MDRIVLGFSVSQWIVAAVTFLVVTLGVRVARGIIRRRCVSSGPADRSWRALAGALNDRWMRLTTLTVAAACAVIALTPDPRVTNAAKVAAIAMLTVQVFRLIPVLIDWLLLRWAGTAQATSDAPATLGTLTGLRWLILFVAYSLILLLALQNMGVDVTSLVAGLGIGGIAVALALQSILGDLFASLTITLDKPFAVGDFIVVGSEMGVVEHVGLKTTRVRSLSGEQLVFGNADLLSSRIRNYKRMSERRVVLGFGVVYSTQPDVLEQINGLVRDAVSSQPGLRFDRCHFFRFGASSLDFELVYYFNSPDYNAHMDAQQAVQLAIARAFRSRGIEFAFPTQTLHIARSAPIRAEA